MSTNDPERAEMAEVGEEAMPLPVDAKTIYLGGIFFILLLAALYEVAEIVWPLVFAFMLSLLLKPPMRLLARLRIPRVLCALLLVVAVFASRNLRRWKSRGRPSGSFAAQLAAGPDMAVPNPTTSLSPHCRVFGNR